MFIFSLNAFNNVFVLTGIIFFGRKFISKKFGISLRASLLIDDKSENKFELLRL